MRTVSPFIAAIVKCEDMTSGKQCRADGCQAKAAYITMSDAGHEPTCEAHTVEYAQVNDIRGFYPRSTPNPNRVEEMKFRYNHISEHATMPSSSQEKPEFHVAQINKVPQKREVRKPRKQAAK